MGSEFMKKGEIFLFLLCISASFIIFFIFSFFPMLSFFAGFSLLMVNYYLFKGVFLSKRKRWFFIIFFFFKLAFNLAFIFLALKFLRKEFFVAGILTFPFFLAFSFLVLYSLSYEWKRTGNPSRASSLS